MIPVLEAASEAELARRIAGDYRAKGYDVKLLPTPAELPASLAAYAPDLVARRGDETVVVEIKSRPSSRSGHTAEALARAVRELPGWRFELVVREPDIAYPLPDTAKPWSAGEARRALRHAEDLVEDGHVEAALLMAWAAAEATLRLLASKEGVEASTKEAISLLGRLTSEGVMARRDHDALRSALELRNAVAHGLKPPRLSASQIRRLIRLSANMLDGVRAV